MLQNIMFATEYNVTEYNVTEYNATEYNVCYRI